MLLATTYPTSVGTWIAIGTLVVMMIPVYISSLKAAQSYGRLEQKVDALAQAAATAVQVNADTNRVIAETIAKLANEFGQHAITDAGNFGELRGMLGGSTVQSPKV